MRKWIAPVLLLLPVATVSVFAGEQRVMSLPKDLYSQPRGEMMMRADYALTEQVELAMQEPRAASICLKEYMKRHADLSLTEEQKQMVWIDLLRMVSNPSYKENVAEVAAKRMACIPNLVKEEKLAHLVTVHTTGYATDVMTAVKNLKGYLNDVVAVNPWNEQSYENTVMPLVIQVKNAHNKWLSAKRTPEEEAFLAEYVAAPIKFGDSTFSITDFIQKYGYGWGDERDSLEEYADYLGGNK